MLTEQSKPESDVNENEIHHDLSKLSVQNDYNLSDPGVLPQVFHVKYLGAYDARGLWGIKHTRKPVDKMVEAAKSLPSGMDLPLLKIIVTEDDVTFTSLNKLNESTNIHKVYSIRDISYGVQDIVYTRIFSMIVVRDTDNFRRVTPFECHGFVCESKYQARQLTYALANAFKVYTEKMKESNANVTPPPKKHSTITIHPQTIRVDIICKT